MRRLNWFIGSTNISSILCTIVLSVLFCGFALSFASEEIYEVDEEKLEIEAIFSEGEQVIIKLNHSALKISFEKSFPIFNQCLSQSNLQRKQTKLYLLYQNFLLFEREA